MSAGCIGAAGLDGRPLQNRCPVHAAGVFVHERLGAGASVGADRRQAAAPRRQWVGCMAYQQVACCEVMTSDATKKIAEMYPDAEGTPTKVGYQHMRSAALGQNSVASRAGCGPFGSVSCV